MKRAETGAMNFSRNRDAFSPNVNNRNQKLLQSGTIWLDTPSSKQYNNLLMSYDVKNSTVVNQANNKRIKQNMLSIEYTYNSPKVIQNETFQSLKSSNNEFIKRVKQKPCKRKITNNSSNWGLKGPNRQFTKQVKRDSWAFSPSKFGKQLRDDDETPNMMTKSGMFNKLDPSPDTLKKYDIPMTMNNQIISPEMIRELNYKSKETEERPSLTKDDMMKLILKRKQSAIDIILQYLNHIN